MKYCFCIFVFVGPTELSYFASLYLVINSRGVHYSIDLYFTGGTESPMISNTNLLDPVVEVEQDEALSATESKSGEVSPQPPASPTISVVKKQSGLSWVHLLGYTDILQRMCSLDAIGVGKEKEAEDAEGVDSGINHNMVRSPLLQTSAMTRVNAMMAFLHAHLPVFAEQCLAREPPANLTLPTSGAATELRIPAKSYAENVYVPQNAVTDPKILASSVAPGVDRSPVSSTDNELCIQWYQPAFEASTPSTSTHKEVFLLFAMGQKTSPVKIFPPKLQTGLPTCNGSPVLGKMNLVLGSLLDLHASLATLRQKGDISLSDKVSR